MMHVAIGFVLGVFVTLAVFGRNRAKGEDAAAAIDKAIEDVKNEVKK